MSARSLRRVAAAASFLVMMPLAAGSTAQAQVVEDGVLPGFSHVFVIIGENTELVQINKNSTPYLWSTFKPDAAWLTNYWAISHFSTSDYVAMTSGQYTPCEQFDYPPARCHQDVPNLFNQLTDAGISWTAWNESMAEPCALVNNGSSKTLNAYAVKHDPAVYYDGVVRIGGVWDPEHRSQLCLDHVLGTGDPEAPNDMSAFEDALASGDVPAFNYVVPNMCEDGHDTCPPNPPSATGQFDQFLAREVPQILASPAFDENSVVIVTYDEGASTAGGGGSNGGTPCQPWETCPDAFHGGGRVAFAVQGDLVRAGVYAEFGSHYGLLRTLEEGFGLTTFVGAANEADPITAIWN
jgi:phosphatidylinositol-3-phosphatase